MDGLHEQLEPGIQSCLILVPFLPPPPLLSPPPALLRESPPTGLAAVSDYEHVSGHVPCPEAIPTDIPGETMLVP